MQKFILFFVSFVFVSLLYAQDASSLADEAQGKADKIAGVVSELQSLASEASSSGDSKLKACVEKQLGAAKGLASAAGSMVSQIASLAAAGKTADAQNQLIALSGMADNADQALAAAQSCEEGGQNQKPAQQQSKKSDNVSNAMKLDIGGDMATEVSRTVEGSDSADAAGIDASDVQQSGNESSAEIAPSAEDPQDATLIEEEEEIEEQSRTK